MADDSAGDLQHPRRNLGNRCRSQAERFVKLARKDPERGEENLQWAEQNARQAVLHDFTDVKNWRTLAHIKGLLNDEEGLRRVLDDAFTVLGRDSEHLSQLEEIDMLSMGHELLEAAFEADPLEPDAWWDVCQERDIETSLLAFSERCKRLDFTDQRANIVYGRRMERILKSGRVELFIDLVQHLLAHRPINHELWLQLGRLHERREEWEKAWLCYDHVQQLRPHHLVRDEFRVRLTAKMDGSKWSEPDSDQRSDFLDRMQSLAASVATKPDLEEGSQEEGQHDEKRQDVDEVELKRLMANSDYAEAFFLARRLLTGGEDWAEAYLSEAKLGLQGDSE